MLVWSDSPSYSTDYADWTPARFFKRATGLESSSDECGILEDDRCIDTDSSRLVRRRESSWVRAVSPPGCQYSGGGRARDLFRLVVPEMLFSSKQQVFLDHSDRCANAMEKEELDGRHFLRPQRDHGEPRCDTPWVHEVDNEEIVVDAMPFQPRFLLQVLIFTHHPYQPRPESTGSPQEALHGPNATFCRSWRLSLIRDVAAAARAVQGRRSSARQSLPAQR